MYARAGLCVLFVVVVTSGCGPAGGASRVNVSGAVTFDGQPVPAGRVTFTPDMAKGGKGVQGYAVIEGGKYNTAAPGGDGPSVGSFIVHVDGVGEKSADYPKGKPLCAHEFPFEVAAGNSTKDIDVPKSASVKARPHAEDP